MCYSAQIWADYRLYVRNYGAELSVKDFVKLFWERNANWTAVKIPKAMEASFMDPQTDDEQQIKDLIDQSNSEQSTKLEQELFTQRKRVADAERKMQSHPTKKAAEDLRIAPNKIDASRRRLADLNRTELLDRDSRVFPGNYAPVLVVEDGRRLVKPMRYLCRLQWHTRRFRLQVPGHVQRSPRQSSGLQRRREGRQAVLVQRFRRLARTDGRERFL